jgi:hypothetical protein
MDGVREGVLDGVIDAVVVGVPVVVPLSGFVTVYDGDSVLLRDAVFVKVLEMVLLPLDVRVWDAVLDTDPVEDRVAEFDLVLVAVEVTEGIFVRVMVCVRVDVRLAVDPIDRVAVGDGVCVLDSEMEGDTEGEGLQANKDK